MAVLKPGRTPDLNQQNYDLYQKALVTEVIPQIEANYHVSKKREDRAIAGLSMGGHESLFVGLTHPELFAWIGNCPPASMPKPSRTSTDQCAEGKPPSVVDGLRCRRRAAEAQPDRNRRAQSPGLPVTAIETPGHHQWPVWRDNLIHFAPLLFQK